MAFGQQIQILSLSWGDAPGYGDQWPSANHDWHACWPVVTEACYLLRHRVDLVQRLLEAVHDGVYELLPLSADDVPDIGGTLLAAQSFGKRPVCGRLRYYWNPVTHCRSCHTKNKRVAIRTLAVNWRREKADANWESCLVFGRRPSLTVAWGIAPGLG